RETRRDSVREERVLQSGRKPNRICGVWIQLCKTSGIGELSYPSVCRCTIRVCTRTRKESKHDRQRYCSCAVAEKCKRVTTSGIAIRHQIGLRIPELVQEAIFQNVDFVKTIASPEITAAGADVTSFDNRVFEYLALHAEVPRMDQARLEIRIEAADGIQWLSGDGIGRSIRKRWWRQCGAITEQGSERQCAEIDVAAKRECAAGIVGKDLRDVAQTFTHEGDGVTSSNYALASVAEEAMKQPVLKGRTPGDTRTRCEVVPIGIVEFFSNAQRS